MKRIVIIRRVRIRYVEEPKQVPKPAVRALPSPVIRQFPMPVRLFLEGRK